MHFIIITADGRPLRMPNGEAILFESEAAARAWLRRGETVAPAPDGLDGVERMQDGEADDGGLA